MKLLLSLFIAAAIAITLHAQKKFYTPKPGEFHTPIDTTPPPPVRYWIHASMRMDTTAYQKSLDTLSYGVEYIGRALLFDDAIFWKDAVIRSMLRINDRVKRDTVKIQGGRK